METRTCDVLVVGAGGAAMRAVLAAHDAGASVIMAVKDVLGSGATGYRASEMAAYNVPNGNGDPNDNPDEFYKDIMTAALGMADPAVARRVADGSIDSYEQLRAWGVHFEMVGDRPNVYKACFSNRFRSHVIKGHGDPIIEALGAQMKKRSIRVDEGMTIAALAMSAGVCGGAVGIDRDGKRVLYSAKAVIMATGGASQMFRRNMNPPDVTGDGAAMAYRAGAELVNLEFMQAGLGVIHPVTNIMNSFLWCGRPELTNGSGGSIFTSLPAGVTPRRVLEEHCKHFPFSTRDDSLYLDVSVQREVAEGRGTPHGGVYADFTMMTDEYVRGLANDYGVHHMWPITKKYLQERGIRVMEERIEIGCFAHAFNGGIRINPDAASSLPGLFAAGETSGGAHGADRLGGNMMVTCQVFGKIAGESAARFAASADARAANDADAAKAMEETDVLLRKKVDVGDVRARLGDVTQNNLLIRRTGQGLSKVLDAVATLEAEIAASPASDSAHVENLAAANLLLMARLTADAAIRRRESRGSHYREDFPKIDESLAAPRIVSLASK